MSRQHADNCLLETNSWILSQVYSESCEYFQPHTKAFSILTIPTKWQGIKISFYDILDILSKCMKKLHLETPFWLSIHRIYRWFNSETISQGCFSTPECCSLSYESSFSPCSSQLDVCVKLKGFIISYNSSLNWTLCVIFHLTL
jgi:hypothetical protein